MAETNSGLSKEYDNYVENYQKQSLSFGHDVDVKAKVYDLAKTLISQSNIGGKDLKNAKDDLLNGFDTWYGANQDGLKGDDFMLFVTKSVLSRVTPAGLKKIQKKYNLSDTQIKVIKEQGLDATESGAKASGIAVGSGDIKDVSEEIILGIVDMCPQCKVGRQAVLLAHEVGRATEAWVEDEATQAEFKRWEKDPSLFMVLAGQSKVHESARRAMMQSSKREPSHGEVEAFIHRQFEKWKKAKDNAKEEAEVLANIKDEFINLKAFELSELGTTNAEKISAFSKEYLDIYKDLMSYRGDSYLPPGGLKKVQSIAMILFRKRNRSSSEYRQLLAKQLQLMGWRKKPEKLTKKQEDDRALHVKNRISRLNHEKLQQVFEFMGIKKRVPKSFYTCLCVTAAYGSSGTRQFYLPSNEFIEPFDERYSCQKPGDPCIVAGFGCGRHPFPKDTKIWGDCMESNRLDMKKDENGKIIPESGIRLDEFIANELQKGR